MSINFKCFHRPTDHLKLKKCCLHCEPFTFFVVRKYVNDSYLPYFTIHFPPRQIQSPTLNILIYILVTVHQQKILRISFAKMWIYYLSFCRVILTSIKCTQLYTVTGTLNNTISFTCVFISSFVKKNINHFLLDFINSNHIFCSLLEC